MATQGIPIPEGASIGVPIPQGASVGEQAPQQTQALPPGQIPLTSHTAATLQGLANVGSGVIDAGKGLLQAFNPKPQPGENAFTASPAGRILKGAIGALSGAPQVPGAISDLAQNGKLLSTVGEIAGNAGGQLVAGAATDAAGESVQLPSAETAGRAARVGGKVLKGTLEDIPGVRQVTKIGKYWKDTAPEAAKPVKSQPAPLPPVESEALRTANTPASKPASQTGEALANQKVITDPAAIQRTLDEILGGKGKSTDGQGELFSQDIPTGSSAPTPIQRAITELGNDAPVKEVAKRATELEQQTHGFEKTFGVDLNDYLHPNGDFDMRNFLADVVKPKTEPPAHVISRVFGSDGVRLLEDASGQPLHKWESTGTDVARGAGKRPQSVTTNGSGESAASQEAINRVQSEKTAGVKRVVIDTRSGIERPIIGTDAVDYNPAPHESVEFRGGPRDGEVISQGRNARPYRRRR
jgi:hypothetical protein